MRKDLCLAGVSPPTFLSSDVHSHPFKIVDISMLKHLPVPPLELIQLDDLLLLVSGNPSRGSNTKANVEGLIKLQGWWGIAYRSLNTQEKLQRKFPNWSLIPSMGCLCFREMETVDHLFLHCDFAAREWSNCLGGVHQATMVSTP